MRTGVLSPLRLRAGLRGLAHSCRVTWPVPAGLPLPPCQAGEREWPALGPVAPSADKGSLPPPASGPSQEAPLGSRG